MRQDLKRFSSRLPNLPPAKDGKKVATVSDVIARLEELRSQHGDLPVVVEDYGMGGVDWLVAIEDATEAITVKSELNGRPFTHILIAPQ